MSEPTVGDHVKWLTNPDAKGPHRYTFGTVISTSTNVGDPTWEIRVADGTSRFIVPSILMKVPGRHLGKGRS